LNPSPFNICHRYTVNIFNPALLMRYAGYGAAAMISLGSDNLAILPRPEDIFMILGWGEARRRGRRDCVSRVGPKTLVSNVDCRRGRVVVFWEISSGQMPALLIRMSRRG
jgi:hypothetical protein